MGDASQNGSRPPNSWLYLAMGFVTLVAATAMAGLLVTRHLNDRPVDLTQATRDLTIKLRGVFEANHIPLNNIQIEPGVKQLSDAAVWRHYDLTVDVPSAINLEGLVQIVKRDFTTRGVIVTGLQEGGRLEKLRLSLGGHVFATVTLSGGFTANTTDKDITPACERLANDVERLLRLRMPDNTAFERDRPVHQEAGGVRWMTTALVVQMDTPGDATAIRDILADRLANDDVTVTLQEAEGALATVVTYLGYDAVRVSLGAVKPAMPDVDLPPMPAEPAPEKSETGLGDELPDLDAPITEDIPMTSPPPSPSLGGSPAPSGTLGQPIAFMPLDSEGLGADVFAPLTLDGPVQPIEKPRVAIIVDDGGNNRSVDEAFLNLDPGLTFAILPFTPADATIAKEGAERGFEIMLHMPMESGSDTVTHPGMIYTSMSEEDIVEYTKAAIDEIPGLKGINNHTGSKFTEYSEGMGFVMALLKERGLYFVDSRTSANSVAPEAAIAAGVPYAVRDVFLDNEADIHYITGQFEELIDKAKRRGYSIGICHFRPVTLKAMESLLPRLKTEGIELVHVSEFVQ